MENKNKREFKLFVIYTGVLLVIICGLLSIRSHAESNVIIAEAPTVVGGENEFQFYDYGSSGFLIDLHSNGGGKSNISEKAPDIIYALDSVSGTSGLNNDVRPVNNNENPADSSEDKRETGSEGDNLDAAAEESSNAEAIEEVYVPDSDDDCPVSDKVPLAIDVQEYIWTKCKRTTDDYKNYYAFILGAIQLESDFKRTAIHHNKNGTTDRGLMQINSCNISSCKRAGLISCTDDLWDIYKNIDCGFHEMDEYVKKFGVCESAYYAYNTGRQNGGSNKASRIVMSNMANWSQIIFG